VTPFFAEHDVALYQGDALTVLAQLPADSVNCVVTSPPYYGLRDYGADGQIGLEPSPAVYVESLRQVFAEVRRVLRPDGVMWLNLGDSYVARSGGYSPDAPSNVARRNGAPSTFNGGAREHLRQTLPAKDKPNFAYGLADKNLLGVPWRVAFALQDDGWTLRNDVIWHKPNAMPESVTDRLSSRYEHVFLFTRSRRYWFDLNPIREPHRSIVTESGAVRYLREGEEYVNRAKAVNMDAHKGDYGRNDGNVTQGRHGNEAGRNPGDVWTIATQPYPAAHFATFPPELARRCILAGCPQDGTVLDPFAGSGTTLMVARKLLRKSVGIELNPQYCELIVDRVGQPIFDFGEATA
jgi:DNA modification methylase